GRIDLLHGLGDRLVGGADHRRRRERGGGQLDHLARCRLLLRRCLPAPAPESLDRKQLTMADMPDAPDAPAAILDDHAFWHHLRFPTFKTFLLIALVIVGILWAAPLLISFFATIDLSDMEHLYGFIFLMVVFDAVVPIF